MSNIFIEILVSQLSFLTHIDRKTLKTLFRKRGLLKENERISKQLSQKIEKLTLSLQNSASIMKDIEIELAQQKMLAEKWTEEAEMAKSIATLNENEVEAIRKILGKENKKSSKLALVWNIIFCIVGLVGGFLLSRL